jgi:ribose 5-phosphate isomerase A
VTDLAALKADAADAAVEAEVRSGMRLGLGTGSTAALMLESLARRLEDGRLERIEGVPTSEVTAARCRELGIPVRALEELPELDVGIDGADEIDPQLRLIKGLGGAFLREKVVAAAARRFVVIADESKLVGRLGDHAPLPVEVVQFAAAGCDRLLRQRAWRPELRMERGRPYVTDEGNHVFDCRRDDWSDPGLLEAGLCSIPGVVAHGLFLDYALAAYVATSDGVRVLGS